MKKIYEWYMLFIGTAGQLLYFLQAYKIFMMKSAADVSLPAFLFGLVAVSSWLLYGFMLNNKVLIVSNIIAVIGALAVVSGIILYS